MWDAGFHWGEWLEPGAPADDVEALLHDLRTRDKGEIGTAFLYWSNVRALAFGLVPDELRAQTAGRLVDLVRAAGTHLGTVSSPRRSSCRRSPTPGTSTWPTSC